MTDSIEIETNNNNLKDFKRNILQKHTNSIYTTSINNKKKIK